MARFKNSNNVNRDFQSAKILAISISSLMVLSPFNNALGQSNADLLLPDAPPQFRPIPGGANFTTLAPKPKNQKVGSGLLELKDSFLNSQPLPGAVSVVQDRVVIKAVATGSGAELLDGLIGVGLQNGAVFGKSVSGTLPLSAISAAESLDTLQYMKLSKPFTRVGAAENQADQAMQSDIAKLNFDVDGEGITIGILSDSYDFLGGEAADIASGDLPNDVNVLRDGTVGPPSDEGRAIAQLIHDIVPGAHLLFRTAFDGPADFAQGILDLRIAEADIIIDDVGYLDQPFFQDGVVAQAVDQVVADGAVYFSSAGNFADNSYESEYRDSGFSTLDFGISGQANELFNLHDFDPATPELDIAQRFELEPGQSLTLSVQWDQPFASSGGLGAASDVDALLYNIDGNLITQAIDGNVGGDAVEVISYRNSSTQTESVFLVIGLFEGPVPGRIKWVNFDDSLPHSFATLSSTIFGQPNAEGAVAVGAAQYNQTPAFGVAPPVVEFFSSHGGTEILFDTAGNLLTSPANRNKPELVAPDGTDTTFFGGGDFDNSGFPDFFGTSAAAPHAAAVAALQLECESSLNPAEIQANQISSAIDMESEGFDNITGAGLIDALAAVGSCMRVATCNGLPITVDLNRGEIPGPGDDVILGTPGNDEIRGRAGNDTICGMGGDDFLQGDSGNDWIDGGDGVDDIRGGAGDDMLFSGSGDTVGTSSKVFGGTGMDTITGGPGADVLSGGPGEDFITGLGGADILNGNIGDDILIGGAGADTLRGGSGENDQLFGDGGSDDLNGGEGANDVCDGGGQGGDTQVNCDSPTSS